MAVVPIEHITSDIGGFAITTLIVFFGGLFCYTIGSLIYNIFFSPLRSYPGPLLWRATRLPYDIHSWRGTLIPKIGEIHLQYGDTVRVQPRQLGFTTDQAIKDVLAHNPSRKEFPKDPKRNRNTPNGIPNILGAENGPHARYRRLLAHAFSEKGMREQEPMIKQYVDLLVDRLNEKASAKETTDMVTWYNLVTFDLIGDLAFGDPFNCLKDRRVHPWVYAVPLNLKWGSINTVLRRWGLEPFRRWLMPKDALDGRRDNYGYAADKIRRRIQHGEDRGDFWDRVISKSVDEKASGYGSTGMTYDEMVNNGSVIVLGGSETTATVLSTATYLLLNHPDKMKKVVDEIRSAYSDESEITLFSVSKLKYMLAALDETQRILPAVSQAGIRVPPKGGALVCGKHVPEGTSIGVHFMSAFHSPSNFHRPTEFIPERFLDEAKGGGEFANDNRAVFQPFSVGTRNCIGRNLAYAEMRLIFAKILFHFDLSLDAKATGDWFDMKSWGVWFKKPLWVRVTPRVQQ